MEGTSWVWVFLLASSSPPGPTNGRLEEVLGDQGLCAPALVAHGPDVGGLWATISCKKSSYIDF